MPDVEEEGMHSRPPQGDAPSLEGLPRTDMGAFGASLPSLVDNAIRGPVIPTRNGPNAFVSLPLGAHSHLWARAQRPPVIDAQSDPDS